MHFLTHIILFLEHQNICRLGFSGSAVVKNLSCNARGTSSIPSPGRPHIFWVSQACVPHLLEPARPGLCTLGPAPWGLHPGLCTLGPAPWGLCPGLCILGPVPWGLCPGLCTLGPVPWPCALGNLLCRTSVLPAVECSSRNTRGIWGGTTHPGRRLAQSCRAFSLLAPACRNTSCWD